MTIKIVLNVSEPEAMCLPKMFKPWVDRRPRIRLDCPNCGKIGGRVSSKIVSVVSEPKATFL